MSDFKLYFKALTGYEPFNWQQKLYERFMRGEIPDVCDMPTGLGKTSVIAVWLIALGQLLRAESSCPIPRRLVYVVDRRTVVDQSTDEAEKWIDKLDKSLSSAVVASDTGVLRTLAQSFKTAACASSETVVGLSTLRGQHADNRAWFSDPARPAIIIGTVDMIGSRLLFAGYGGVGRYYRSTQAGLLGQDSLIVIDEAQLSPTFEETARRLQNFIRKSPDIRRSYLMTLSATINDSDETEKQAEPLIVFGRDEIADEIKNCNEQTSPTTRETSPTDIVCKRLLASKKLEWLPIAATTPDKPKAKEINENFAVEIVKTASRFFNEHAAVIIYLNTVEMVNLVAKKLEDAMKDSEVEDVANRILKLTGEMRGDERDKLFENNEIFKYFTPQEDRVLTEGCRFIVATAAGEVGINLDADYGICDLVSLERMIQRCGRINRFGNVKSIITVAYDTARLNAREALEASPQNDSDAYKNTVQPLDTAAYYAFRALQASADKDGNINVSPLALRELEGDKRAWSVPPVCPPLDSARIDDWSLTTLNQNEYPRPLVAYWLRGVTADDTATTTFCWRADLKYAASDDEDAIQMIKTIPIAPREKADVAIHRAITLTKELAKKSPESRIVMIDGNGAYTAKTLGELCNIKDGKSFAKDDELRSRLSFTTLVLPIEVGGLDEDGNPLAPPLKAVASVEDVVIHELTKGDDSTDKDVLTGREKWLRLVIKRTGKDYFVTGTLGAKGIVESDETTSQKSFSSLQKLARNYDRKLDFVSNEAALRANDDADDEDDNAGVKSQTFIAYLLKRNAPEHFMSGDETTSLQSHDLYINQHNRDVERYARVLCEKLNLDSSLAEAFALAASRHDNGKARRCWQSAIGNKDFDNTQETALAKSNGAWFDFRANANYRHEFGSLVEALDDEEINAHPHRELILHLIAAHHGYARPYFPERAFDRERLATQASAQIALDAMKRFARLQQQYGWWQLAYLEALLKAADGLASKEHGDKQKKVKTKHDA